MEGQKKSGSSPSSSSSSSSFTSELFGSIESQRSSSSAGIFASMFPPPGTAEGSQQQDWGSKKGSPGMGQQEKAQPCHLSSSLYYGGQDIYSSTSSTTNSTGQRSTKDKEDGDPNGNNSQGASRGNWWQGSLYY